MNHVILTGRLTKDPEIRYTDSKKAVCSFTLAVDDGRDSEGKRKAQFIPRSKGGLGIPENILTLCRACHDRFDNGTRFEREGMLEFFREYLMSQYTDWNEDNLTYRKEKL